MLATNLIDYSKEHYGEYPFIYFEGKEFTNFDVERMAKKFSVLLRNNGVCDGERVVVCMPNCPEVVFSYQGILRSRSIIIPLLHLLHASEIRFILSDSMAKAIITSSAVLPKFLEVVQGLHYKPLFIVIDKIEDPTPYQELNIIQLQEELDKIDESQEILKDADENDVAVILYTSGTTGRPKGVMLTHKNIYSNTKKTYDVSKKERGTTIGVLPLAHAFGFTMMNANFLLGHSVVILSKFDVEKVFECIEKYKVRSFTVVPAMVFAMVAHPSAAKYDLSSLEWVGSGSAPLPLNLIEGFRRKFNAEVREGYGLSEATTVVTTMREGIPIKYGSVGIPLPGVEVRIVDDNGDDVPTGEVGEIIVRGDNVSPGYYGLEEETKKTIRNGWLYSGDLGKLDEDGYLYVIDRKKDMIIRGGFNIFPRDIEEVISKHEGVREVAVIGIPDEKMGEEVAAVVVKKPGAIVSEEEIILYTQEKLVKFKTPRKVFFVDQLPRNGVGKILKKKLREMYTDHPSMKS